MFHMVFPENVGSVCICTYECGVHMCASVVCVCARVIVCAYAYMYTNILRMYTCTFTHIYTSMHMRIYINTYLYVHLYIHTYIYISFTHT